MFLVPLTFRFGSLRLLLSSNIHPVEQMTLAAFFVRFRRCARDMHARTWRQLPKSHPLRLILYFGSGSVVVKAELFTSVNQGLETGDVPIAQLLD